MKINPIDSEAIHHLVEVPEGSAQQTGGYSVSMKTEKPKKMHKSIRYDLHLVIHKHMPEGATAELVLAIASQIVGQLLAMQDQRKHTATEMIELIQANIEVGNQHFVAELMKADGLKPPYIN